jgi:hypothetical protein
MTDRDFGADGGHDSGLAVLVGDVVLDDKSGPGLFDLVA